MRRFIAITALTVATLWPAAGAMADPSEYGIETVGAGASTPQAGAHPDFTVSLRLRTDSAGELPSTTKDLRFDLPPGLLANPNAIPRCSAAQLIGTDVEDPSNQTGCPQSSQVGVTEIELFKEGEALQVFEPIFNMEPRYGEPARFGFIADIFPVFVDTELRPDREYAATAKVEAASAFAPISFAASTFWGVPADESHDTQRITPYESVHSPIGVPHTANGKRAASLVPVPYMLNPTRCGVPQGVNISAISYALPELRSEAFAALAPNSGCGLLNFSPTLLVKPTTAQAETGSGLDAELTFPTDGLESPNLFAESEQKRAEVILPEGVSVNPSQAVGLGVCSEADFARETAASGPAEGCPETSKIGSVSAKSPLLEETAEGSLYIAKPHANPFGTLIALYLVLKVPERGVIVKLAGRVTSDPETGQLTTTFGEAPYEIPQLPVESFHLHFREGARSPLITPRACGTYTGAANFTSWAGKQATTHPSFQISSGVNGGACPSGGLPPFKPGLVAGTLNNAAGSYSPFSIRLSRNDGEQEITHFSIKLPPGVTGKLAGIPFCPDAAIAAAKARSGPDGGAEELESPSCPAASEVGHTLAGAGAGQVLAYAPGKVYLAGPYHGSALSIVAITAAKVGPFDLGTVVVREALKVNPETAEVFIDAAGSDPLPHIIAGIPVHLRDIRAYVDRPGFVLNPTNCKRTSTASTVLGAGLDFASEADDRPITVTSPFQVADCASLGFKPKLALSLGGGTKRAQNPTFKAVLTTRPGDANIGKAQVTLPHSEFLDNSHIRTICTRVQFAAGEGNGSECPAGSIYGYAKAITPLLDDPIQGPVYLRSSSHNLPDLVAALHNGKIDIDLVGRIDSVKGGRIRNSFEAVPDAPVTKFILTMRGGKKGLLVNSTNLCARDNRAVAAFTGQNGKVHNFKPRLRPDCPKKGRHRHHHGR